MTREIPSAQAWFAGGERIGYDPNARAIVQTPERRAQSVPEAGRRSRSRCLLPPRISRWLLRMGEGSALSAEWRRYAEALPRLRRNGRQRQAQGLRLFNRRAYGSCRSDLARFRRPTTLVAFDFSSLVVLEHLRRRLQRAQRGKPAGAPDIHGVFIFNGGLFTDGHSHPWYTTPMLRRLPNRARQGVGRPLWLFKRMPGIRNM